MLLHISVTEVSALLLAVPDAKCLVFTMTRALRGDGISEVYRLERAGKLGSLFGSAGKDGL